MTPDEDDRLERLQHLEKTVYGNGDKDDPGIIPRLVSLERDRNLIRWALAGLIGVGSAVIKWWADHQKP